MIDSGTARAWFLDEADGMSVNNNGVDAPMFLICWVSLLVSLSVIMIFNLC